MSLYSFSLHLSKPPVQCFAHYPQSQNFFPTILCGHVLKLQNWSYCASMIWHMHRLYMVSGNSHYDHVGFSKKKYSSPIVMCSSPVLSWVFICCNGAVGQHQVLFQTWENTHRSTWNASSCLCKYSYLTCTAMNDLREWKWGMDTLKMIKRLPAINCSKSRYHCNISRTGGQGSLNDHKLMEY